MANTLPEAINAALRDALAEIGPRMVETARERIGQELPEWAPLADSTIAEKQRLGFTGQVSPTDPNLRTGAYRDSFAFEIVADWPHFGIRLSNTSPVAEFLEHGTATAPPRPSLAPTVDQYRDEITATAKQVAQQTANAWTRDQLRGRLPGAR
jgi:hypothetical protein